MVLHGMPAYDDPCQNQHGNSRRIAPTYRQVGRNEEKKHTAVRPDLEEKSIFFLLAFLLAKGGKNKFVVRMGLSDFEIEFKIKR